MKAANEVAKTANRLAVKRVIVGIDSLPAYFIKSL
jgi:hypothetical protein